MMIAARWLFVLALIGVGCSLARVVETQTQSTTQALSLQRGVNLTGWFQFGEFQEARFSEIQLLRDSGIDFIRLPIQPTLLYDQKSTTWALLKRVLLEARRVKMRVIVDFHSALNTQREILTGDQRFLELLGSMGTFLLPFLDVALLEPMNEPISPTADTCDPAFDWDSWQKKFYQAARATNKDITLVLTGACWGGIDGLLKSQPIADKNIMYSVHYYDPMMFSHQGASWTGAESRFLKNIPYPPTPANVAAITPSVLNQMPTAALKNQMRDMLSAYGKSGFEFATIANRLAIAQAWATKNNAKLLLGEFGALIDEAPPQDRVRYVNDVRNAAERLGIAYAMWDFNPNGGFGPYRNGQPEKGMFEAMGARAPTNAVPTPANAVPNSTYLLNPVPSNQLLIADFANGSQNVFGTPTTYYAYGQPTQPTFTPAINNAAPVQNGQLEFDFKVPNSNDYGGVVTNIPVAKQGIFDARVFGFIRFELSLVGGGQVRVGVASSKVDDNGDRFQFTVDATDTPTVYTLALEAFRQGGWGKKVVLEDVLRQLEQIEVTAMNTGQPSRIRFDNLVLLNMVEASVVPNVPAALQNVLFDFSLAGQAGNQGGEWSVSAYQQNAARVATATSEIIGNTLKVNFDIPQPNEYAGASVNLNFGSVRNLLNTNALRLELSALGAQTVRVEFPSTLDSANDHPQFRVQVSPQQTTYRIPISEFYQAGWGKAVDRLEALRNAKGINVIVDTVGTKGTLRLDQVVLEQKP